MAKAKSKTRSIRMKKKQSQCTGRQKSPKASTVQRKLDIENDKKRK